MTMVVSPTMMVFFGVTKSRLNWQNIEKRDNNDGLTMFNLQLNVLYITHKSFKSDQLELDRFR